MPTPQSPTSGNAELDAVNEQFHSAYDGAENKSEHDAPMLVLFADQLRVRRNGATTAIEITPKSFHAIKSVTHAPIALYVLLRSHVDEALSEDVIDRLRRLRDQTAGASLAVVEAEPGTENVVTLIRRTLTLLDAVLGSNRASSADLADFAIDCGNLVGPLTEAATAIQLRALHDAVETIVRSFSPEEKSSFEVVVAGDHQARARSLGMQYFEKRLGEKPGAETRIFYAEGAASIDDAARVCGAARLNRDLARAFFGDEKRLQRDILGDAAAKLLATRGLDP